MLTQGFNRGKSSLLMGIRVSTPKKVLTLHSETEVSSRWPRPDGPHRAIASTAVAIAKNDENVDNDENGSPSHRKSTMTSLTQSLNASTDASGCPYCRLRPDGPSQLCSSPCIRIMGRRFPNRPRSLSENGKLTTLMH